MILGIMKKDMLWEGTIKLVDWDNFFETEQTLTLNIGGDCIVDELTDVHENGYRFLLDHQAEILKTSIDEIYDHYPIWQEEYSYEEEEKSLLMPDITDMEDLKSLLKPRRIYILDTKLDNLPYLGIEFQCSWNEEHGVGVMLYKDRVIKVGGADTAFLNWIAEEDKEKYS